MFDLQPPRHISTLRVSPVAKGPLGGIVAEADAAIVEKAGSFRRTPSDTPATAAEGAIGHSRRRQSVRGSLLTRRWRNADSNHRSSPASARELRHLLARCGRPNVRGLIDEDSNPGPDTDRRSLPADLPVRELVFPQVADQRVALRFR